MHHKSLPPEEDEFDISPFCDRNVKFYLNECLIVDVVQ